jgi:sodium/bile acid cotransporter 7
VALARGHVAAAVTAAAVSNLLGVLISPALLTLLVAGSATGSAGTGEVSTEGLLTAIQGVALMVLAPFVAGQVAGPLLRPLLLRQAALATWVDRSVIAALVYQAVGQSVTSGVGDGLDAGALIGTAGVAAALFALLAALGLALGRALGLSRSDQVVVGVCGGMKSMATGLPMLRVLFGDSPEAGLLALPLVLFHQVQLLLLSLWAGRVQHPEASRPDDGARGPVGDRPDGPADRQG